MFEKKAGEGMLQYIDWMLFSDNKLLICRKNEESIFELNKSLIYETEKEYNKIDFVKKIFVRKTDELFMEIDFSKKTCKFDFGIEGTCSFDIECSFKYNDEEIELLYSLDDSYKKVSIKFNKLVI